MKKIKRQELILAVIFLSVLAVIFMWSPKSTEKKSNQTEGNLPVSTQDMDFGNGTQDIVITGDRKVAPGTYEYKSFNLKSGILGLNTGETQAALVIKAKEKIVISNTAKINVSGNGYGGPDNPDKIETGQGINYSYAGGGGSLGGVGGSGSCSESKESGLLSTMNLQKTYGMAGGVGQKIKGTGGNGGGYLMLIAPEIVIDGEILADGLQGENSGGGGAGGKIVILGNKVMIKGKISAIGGSGGTSQIQGAGGGGGGVIIVSKGYENLGKIVLNGGQGGQALDLYTGCEGKNGFKGKLLIAEKS